MKCIDRVTLIEQENTRCGMKRQNFESCENIIMKKSKSCSNIPSQTQLELRKSAQSELISILQNSPANPADFLRKVMEGEQVDINVIIERSQQDNFYIEHTEEQISCYSQDVITAIRSRDISTIRLMHNSGRHLQCCNRFGESLIHMACRRGFLDVAKYFIEDASVSIRVKDDYGRTPLHDACWCREPNFALMDLLINQCAELLFISDKRGHTPLQYTRREHWKYWNAYLLTRAKTIREKVNATVKITKI